MSKNQKINNRKDILLLLLYSPTSENNFNEPIIGRTRLVKLLFIFKMEVFKSFVKNLDFDIENFYEFYSWDYGPFSKDVYDDLTFFILNEFVVTSNLVDETLPESAAEWDEWISSAGIDDSSEIDVYYDEEFKLTSKGCEFTKGMWEQLSPNQIRILKNFKKKLNSAPLRAILNYVYKNYSEYTNKSKIKDQVI